MVETGGGGIETLNLDRHDNFPGLVHALQESVAGLS